MFGVVMGGRISNTLRRKLAIGRTRPVALKSGGLSQASLISSLGDLTICLSSGSRRSVKEVTRLTVCTSNNC